MNAIVPTSLVATAVGRAPEPASAAPSSPAVRRIGLVGEMAAGIVHDFRNVLAVIGSALNLAESQLGNASKSADYLKVAREGVERGSRLASRLLALAGANLPEPRPADLSALVGELLPFIRHAAGPGVAVRLDRRAGPAQCTVDPQQFNTALLNLVVNARDAMPGGGEIGIRTDEIRAGTCDTATGAARRFVRVRVADTGEGMAADVSARIFDPWFTTKGDTGTGLGLPQVHRFVSAAGGSIALFSEPGRGTALDLFFPIDEDPPPDLDLSNQLSRWTNEGGSAGAARPGE